MGIGEQRQDRASRQVLKALDLCDEGSYRSSVFSA